MLPTVPPKRLENKTKPIRPDILTHGMYVLYLIVACTAWNVIVGNNIFVWSIGGSYRVNLRHHLCLECLVVLCKAVCWSTFVDILPVLYTQPVIGTHCAKPKGPHMRNKQINKVKLWRSSCSRCTNSTCSKTFFNPCAGKTCFKHINRCPECMWNLEANGTVRW